jgi:hypothetical protein
MVMGSPLLGRSSTSAGVEGQVNPEIPNTVDLDA